VFVVQGIPAAVWPVLPERLNQQGLPCGLAWLPCVPVRRQADLFLVAAAFFSEDLMDPRGWQARIRGDVTDGFSWLLRLHDRPSEDVLGLLDFVGGGLHSAEVSLRQGVSEPARNGHVQVSAA